MSFWRNTRSRHRRAVDAFLASVPMTGTIVRVGWSDREQTTGGITLNWIRLDGVQVLGDANDLPIRSYSCDWISCVEMCYLLWDRSQFARECARVLRPGGHLLVTEVTECIATDDRYANHVTPTWWVDRYFGMERFEGWTTGYGLVLRKPS